MYSVSMALVDFIPVILFAVAAVILQRDQKPKPPASIDSQILKVV